MKHMFATAATAALLASGSIAPAAAQALNPYLGQVMLVGFGFCPSGWTEAAGQILPISTNSALFSLYGTTFGGNGQTTFALPDLRGRVPIHLGTGPGLPTYLLGQAGGATTTTLTVAQLPSHSHLMMGTSANVSSNVPTNNLFGVFTQGGIYDTNGPVDETMNPKAIANTGGNQPIDNHMPYITLRYCIALTGIFPPRP